MRGTPRIVGGSSSGGTPVSSLTGTPQEVVYIDNAGNGTGDSLFTRDSSTNETYVGMLQSAGAYTTSFQLGTVLPAFGGLLGVGLEQTDSTTFYAFSGIVDATTFGAAPGTIVSTSQDIGTGDQGLMFFLPTRIGISTDDGTIHGEFNANKDLVTMQTSNSTGDNVYVEADLNGGGGNQRLRIAATKSGPGDNGIEVNNNYISFDFSSFTRTPGQFFDIDSGPTVDGQVLTGYADGSTAWAGIPPASAALTAKYIGYGDGSNLLTGNADYQYNDTYSLVTQITPDNSDSLTYGPASFTGPGLDDLTLTWDAVIYGSNKYGGSLVITIDSTGGTDTISWSFTGSYSQIIGSGTGIPITGGVQTLNDTDGNKIAEIQFGSITGHTLNNHWNASTYLGGNQKGYRILDNLNHEFLVAEPNGGTYRFGDDGTNGGSTWYGNGTQLVITDGTGELGLFAPRYIRMESPSGNTVVLSDMQNGVWSQYGDFRVRDLATSSVWFHVDTASREVSIGDVQSAGNDTLFTINDNTATMTATLNGVLTFQRPAGQDFMILNTATPAFSVGDLDGVGNSTRILLADGTSAISLISGGDVIRLDLSGGSAKTAKLGDTTGVANGTALLIDDVNEVAQITATNGLEVNGDKVVTITDNIALTAQTASIGATSIAGTNAVGLYEVNFYLVTTTADAGAGTVSFSLAWNDGTASRTATSAALALTSTGFENHITGAQGGTYYYNGTGAAIQYSTTVVTIGTADYALYVTAKKVD